MDICRKCLLWIYQASVATAAFPPLSHLAGLERFVLEDFLHLLACEGHQHSLHARQNLL